MARYEAAVARPSPCGWSRRTFVALLTACLCFPLLGGLARPAAATAAATHLLALQIVGIGGFTISYDGNSYDWANTSGGTYNLGGYNLPEGTVVTLTVHTPLGQEFLGWNVAGVQRNWASTLTLTVTDAVAVGATFQSRPTFPDVPPGGRYEAIFHLAGHNIVRGYEDGTFGPSDRILRAQMAGLIARTMGWDGQQFSTTFADRCNASACVDAQLWANVSALAFHNVARGYDPATFAPFDNISTVQMVSLVTRGMVARGYWADQPERADIYPNVPADSGHRQDLATYVHYAGALPLADMFYSYPLPGWDQPTNRATFADVLWQALDRTLSRPESRYYPDAPLP